MFVKLFVKCLLIYQNILCGLIWPKLKALKVIITANKTIKAEEKQARLGFLNTGGLKRKQAES